MQTLLDNCSANFAHYDVVRKESKGINNTANHYDLHPWFSKPCRRAHSMAAFYKLCAIVVYVVMSLGAERRRFNIQY